MNINEIIQNINEILQNSIYETQDLYEFAINRKKVKDKIEDYADTIVDHICKIIYLRHIMPTTVHHWCVEINAKLENIIQIQMKGGTLKQSTLFQWLRNGLTNPQEMKDRRYLVAMQEKIEVSQCKELQPEKDYKEAITIIQKFAELIISCRKHYKLPTVQDIREIIK